MLNNLPLEILIEIFKCLPLLDLLNLKRVNKKFNAIVKKNKWENITVKINKNIPNRRLKKFIKTHSFINYDLNGCKINNNILKFLKVNTLSLSNCRNITNKGLKNLLVYNMLDLSYSTTDEGLKYLSCYQDFNLEYFDIMDEGLVYLTKKILNLSFCKITVED